MAAHSSTRSYFDDLKSDIRKYAQNSVKYTVIEIRDDLDRIAHKAIDDFYNDYEPQYYYRNYYNFSKKMIRKFYHNKNNFYYTGGVILSNEFMDDIYYRIQSRDGIKAQAGERVGTLDQVYYSVVELGYHGLPIVGTPHMKKSPLEIIEKRQQYIIKNMNQYRQKGKQRAQQETYKVLFQK